MESEDELALCSDRGPDPNTFGILFDFGHQFIQLQMADGQSPVEQSLMEAFTVLATAFNPAGDGGVVMVEDTGGGGDVNAFRHGSHDHGNLAQRCFQPIQRRAKSTGSATATCLTLEIADTLLTATAVADQSVNRRIRDGEVVAQGVEASMTAGVDRLWTATAALALRPGQYIQFGALGEEGAIAITSWAVFWRLWFQVAGAASLAEVILYPAADATTVVGPDVDGQAEGDEQDTFEGSWIELHELNG